MEFHGFVERYDDISHKSVEFYYPEKSLPGKKYAGLDLIRQTFFRRTFFI